jgi:hypothetical protein
VASLLEIARILTVIPASRHPIVLLVTDGEEAGLLGAQLFTREHRLAKLVKAAVNMEARGVSGPSLMFETGSANAWLMRLYGAATLEPITNSLCYVIYKSLPNNTDFTVFKAASYQGFNLAFIGDVGHYHTPLDSWANASASTIQHQGDNATSALLALANSAGLHPPEKDSVFFDVFARSIVVWPTAFVLPAALVALTLLLAEAVLLFRKGLLNGRQAAYGLIGTLANLMLGGLLSVGVLALLRVLRKVPPLDGLPWIAYPLAMHIGFSALALLSAGLIAAWLARGAGFWGFWFGGAVLVALLAVVSAAALPGASYVLLLAAMAAALAPLPCVRSLTQGRSVSQGAADFAVLVPGLVMFAAQLPLLLLLYAALGAVAWPICTVMLCLTACFLVPLLANATRGARQFITLLAAATTFLGISVTVLLPMYSSSWPQRLNVEYWTDADSGRAHWWTQPASLHLPRDMASAAKFDPVPRERYAGYPLTGFFAEAAQIQLAAPELTQISATPGASRGTTHFELLVRSVRGAPTAFVVFPESANVQEILVATRAGALRAKLHRFRNGISVLGVAGMAAEGLQFGIDSAAAAASPVLVFDLSYGLPAQLPEGKALQRARPQNATSSQDGDITVVQRTVRLDPAAGR